jgi:hypothetical protein
MALQLGLGLVDGACTAHHEGGQHGLQVGTGENGSSPDQITTPW